MKILTLILFFYVTVFGNNLDKSYNKLNDEIDKISEKLTIEEKISLYYLTLSTHDEISTLLYKHQNRSTELQTTKNNMLFAITNLQKNENISTDERKKLRNLYATMNHEAKKIMQRLTQKMSQSDKVISKQSDKKQYIESILFAFTMLFMFISSILAYLLYQSKNTHVSKEDFPIINELEKQNRQLSEQVMRLQMETQEELK